MNRVSKVRFDTSKLPQNPDREFTLSLSNFDLARLDLSERQQASQKLTACMQDNVSIWLDIEKAKLEEQQDAELAPLQYQETMWELEKEQAELKLKRINAQLETYDQLLSQETEKSAPKFGLG